MPVEYFTMMCQECFKPLIEDTPPNEVPKLGLQWAYGNVQLAEKAANGWRKLSFRVIFLLSVRVGASCLCSCVLCADARGIIFLRFYLREKCSVAYGDVTKGILSEDVLKGLGRETDYRHKDNADIREWHAGFALGKHDQAVAEGLNLLKDMGADRKTAAKLSAYLGAGPANGNRFSIALVCPLTFV